MKTKFLACSAMLAALALAPPALAEGETYAIVTKVLNNAFTPPIKDGCEAAAKEIGASCVFVGPTEYNEPEQIRMLQDIMARSDISGIAVDAGNPKAMARILQRGMEGKDLPIVTISSDFLDEDHGLRKTFIGTNNYAFGTELAKKVVENKPKGGTVCIQSGAPTSLNLELRVQAVRDVLGGGSKDKPVERLTGQNGWTEPDGCPIYNNDDVNLAAQQLNDVIVAHPDLGALVAVGGWAQYAPQAYTTAVNRVRERVDSKDFYISMGDTFAPQMPLLKQGLSHVNVGQRPYDMGYEAVMALHKLKGGESVPPTIETGFQVCLPADADTCGKEK